MIFCVAVQRIDFLLYNFVCLPLLMVNKVDHTVRQLGHLTVCDEVLMGKIQRRFTRMVLGLKTYTMMKD